MGFLALRIRPASLDLSQGVPCPDAKWLERRLGADNGREIIMKGFVQDIEGLAVKNNEFRRVLYTAKHCQLVVMALKPKEEIRAEVHTPARSKLAPVYI